MAKKVNQLFPKTFPVLLQTELELKNEVLSELIENRDGILKYYVNDKLLSEFNSAFSTKNPYFAFFISGEGLVTYDDFIITDKDQ